VAVGCALSPLQHMVHQWRMTSLHSANSGIVTCWPIAWARNSLISIIEQARRLPTWSDDMGHCAQQPGSDWCLWCGCASWRLYHLSWRHSSARRLSAARYRFWQSWQGKNWETR